MKDPIQLREIKQSDKEVLLLAIQESRFFHHRGCNIYFIGKLK